MNLLQAAVHGWSVAWRKRAGELVGARAGGVWSDGYEGRPRDVVAVLGEGSVRIAELLGVGVLAQAVEYASAGRRYRRLSHEETAFAKTYFDDAMLRRVRIDEGAHRTAGRLRIAYVFGYVIKVSGPPGLPLLLHELAHVRQYERWGWAYVAKALWAQHRGGGYAYRPGTPGALLNAEQEAARLEDDVRAELGLPRRYRL